MKKKKKKKKCGPPNVVPQNTESNSDVALSTCEYKGVTHWRAGRGHFYIPLVPDTTMRYYSCPGARNAFRASSEISTVQWAEQSVRSGHDVCPNCLTCVPKSAYLRIACSMYFKRIA